MAKTLYIGNLPWKTKEEELADFIGAHASVISSRIIKERDSGRSKGYGFIEVEDSDAEKVVKLNGADFGGRSITVSEARAKKNLLNG